MISVVNSGWLGWADFGLAGLALPAAAGAAATAATLAKLKAWAAPGWMSCVALAIAIGVPSWRGDYRNWIHSNPEAVEQLIADSEDVGCDPALSLLRDEYLTYGALRAVVMRDARVALEDCRGDWGRVGILHGRPGRVLLSPANVAVLGRIRIELHASEP